jgi:thermitase
MKLKQTAIRAGFALAIALPLLGAVSPTSQASEAPPGQQIQLVRPSGSTAWAQPGATPAPATPGPTSSQSVGAPGASSGSSVRLSGDAAPPAQAQPAGSAAAATPSTTASSTTSPAASTVSTQVDGFQVETAPDGKPARAGSLIVTFKPSVQSSARATAHRELQAQAVEPIGAAGAVRVQVQPGTLGQAISNYAARSDVQQVQPDYVVYADMTPNDPRYGDQWGPGKIQAPAAWDKVGGAAGVRVAVLDTGMANHPDLASHIIAAADFTGSPYGTVDRHGHGTHTSGTVAATANNSIGVVGVAYSANLLNGKVLGDSGAGSLSSVASGITWAADNGAQVISMSLGANLDCTNVIQDAADYAWAKGAVLLAAAGNDGLNDVHTPANCNHIIPVGALESNDGRASFSNYGAVPIAAPGVMVLSTGKDGDYTWMSGTSMATPHAAGVAALIWASSYGTSNQSVVARLFSTADRVAGTGQQWTYGRVNASAAVGAGGAAPAPTPQPTPTVAPTMTTPVGCSPRPPVTVRSARAGAGSLRVTVTVNGASSGTNRFQQVRFGAGTNAVIDTGGSQAQGGNFAVDMPAGAADYSFTIRRVNGGAVTVPLTVVDNCGEWKTFVGGGAGAF